MELEDIIDSYSDNERNILRSIITELSEGDIYHAYDDYRFLRKYFKLWKPNEDKAKALDSIVYTVANVYKL